ncbi:MAG: DUF2752 domain-containing protein [Pirellulales bacterium]
MTEKTKSGPATLSLRQRLFLAVTGTALAVLLAVAVVLRPSPLGHGTHQQLGLPPCTFLVLFNRRCPSCGMTTAWAHVVRGQWTRAARANVGGALLAVAAIVVAPWALVCAGLGRACGWMPSERVVIGAGLGFLGLTLAEWAWRLWAG